MIRFCLCIAAAVSVNCAIAQSDDKPRQRERKSALIAAVVAAESMPLDLWEAYRNLFSTADADDLEQLKRHVNTTISLQAAWQDVLAKMPDSGEPERQNTKLARARFVGFVEGRTRVSVPPWWANTFLIGTRKATKRLYHRVDGGTIWAPVDTTVERDHDRYAISKGANTILLPDSILPKADDGSLWCRFSAKFTKDRCFIAVHDDVGDEHDVVCLDRTGKVIWVAQACGSFIMGATSGLHESWVSIVLHDGQIIVFGAAWTGNYVHAFDADTGESRFRFSTGYGVPRSAQQF